MFDETTFNWKESIHKTELIVVRVETRLNGHLDSHRFWKKFWCGLLITIVGATIASFWYCISNGFMRQALCAILEGGK